MHKVVVFSLLRIAGMVGAQLPPGVAVATYSGLSHALSPGDDGGPRLHLLGPCPLKAQEELPRQRRQDLPSLWQLRCEALLRACYGSSTTSDAPAATVAMSSVRIRSR